MHDPNLDTFKCILLHVGDAKANPKQCYRHFVSWAAIGSQSLLEIKAARDSCPRVGRSVHPSSSFFTFFCLCQAGIHLSASKTGIIWCQEIKYMTICWNVKHVWDGELWLHFNLYQHPFLIASQWLLITKVTNPKPPSLHQQTQIPSRRYAISHCRLHQQCSNCYLLYRESITGEQKKPEGKVLTVTIPCLPIRTEVRTPLPFWSFLEFSHLHIFSFNPRPCSPTENTIYKVYLAVWPGGTQAPRTFAKTPCRADLGLRSLNRGFIPQTPPYCFLLCLVAL